MEASFFIDQSVKFLEAYTKISYNTIKKCRKFWCIKDVVSQTQKYINLKTYVVLLLNNIQIYMLITNKI